MRNQTKIVLAAAASALAAVAMSACTASPQPNSPAPAAPTTAPAEPGIAPTEEASSSGGFEGEISNETITANQMQIEVPKGIRIPENALVTSAERNSIMMADQDGSAIQAMIDSSAAAAGYTVYGEGPKGKVYVGNGNAVLFSATPGAYLLTWGPENMKDVLSQ